MNDRPEIVIFTIVGFLFLLSFLPYRKDSGYLAHKKVTTWVSLEQERESESCSEDEDGNEECTTTTSWVEIDRTASLYASGFESRVVYPEHDFNPWYDQRVQYNAICIGVFYSSDRELPLDCSQYERYQAEDNCTSWRAINQVNYTANCTFGTSNKGR